MERCVLVQGAMRPRLIIIGGIRAYDSVQVRFPEYDHVVQALPADRANEPSQRKRFARVIGTQSADLECPWRADAARRLARTRCLDP